MKLSQDVLNAIYTHELLPYGKEKPVVVALSGGADSVAILDILVDLGYKCVAAHCNFHLRGPESDRDEEFSRHLASRLGVGLRVRDFDIKGYLSTHNHVSVEMACRTLRYQWFESLRADVGAQAIATGHHRDDNTETFFLNLLRRSGISGLAGMKWRNEFVIRPLLASTRRQIEEYLLQRGLSYVFDHTNLENQFRRNRIRNVVMPCIREEFPNADEAISASIFHLRQAADFIVAEARRLYAKYCGKNGSDLDIFALRDDYPRHWEFLLFEMLKEPEGISMDIVESISRAINESGRVFSFGGNEWLLDRGHLIKMGMDSDPVEPVLQWELCTVTEFDPKDASPDTILLDASVMDGNPDFAVRKWEPGDRLAPFGMRGTKKVSDILSDAKASLARKRNVCVLTRNGEILWVIGFRASRHFAVTSATKSFYKIGLKK